jgi:hypothetical protein
MPPSTLDGATVLFWTLLAVSEDDVKALAIAKYSTSAEVYLFYCNEQWEVLNDSMWASIEDARAFVANDHTHEWTEGARDVPTVAPSRKDVDDETLRAVVASEGELPGVTLLRQSEGLSLFDAMKRVKSVRTES